MTDMTPTQTNGASSVPPVFCTGFGQYDTHVVTKRDGQPNDSPNAGKPYAGISGKEIVSMAGSPPSVPKEQAQWFIPSDYLQADARSHDAQIRNGRFWWLALDVDENDLALADVKAALDEVVEGVAWVVYSSRSAKPDNRKWRALVPLLTPLAGADYADTQNAFFDLLERASGGVLIPDRALARAGQPIYLPNRGPDFYEVHINQAKRLNLDPLNSIIQRRDKLRADRAAVEAEAKARREKRERERLANPAKESPVETFNARHSVEDLLARYGYIRAGSSNDWKSRYQTGTSFATRSCGDYWVSLSGSDAAADLGTASKTGHRHGDAFDLFVHYEHGGDFTAAVRAYGEELRGEVKANGGNRTVDIPNSADLGLRRDEIHEADKKPTVAKIREAKRPRWCVDTACSILETDPAWAGVLAHDEFAGLNMLLRPIPGSTVHRATFSPRPMTENDITAAVRWFNRNDFPDATKNAAADALFLVASQNIISPVRHYLESLTWDQTPRVTEWLTRYCGADPTELTSKVGRAWLISAVARAVKPGCKADCALVLEGRQGAGKSSILRALAGDDWFHDGLRDMHGKDASAGLRGKWIIELPELSAMRRSDTEAVKAFLSRNEERYRPAYGRAEVVEPRRCVFAGTTNRSDYLTDDTGGRRFWPVTVHDVKLDDLLRDRDQLWAEAVALYRAGEKWWLDRDAEAAAAVVVGARAADDPWAADVLRVVDGMVEVSSRDVFEMLDVPLDRRTKADAMRITGILTRAGWVRDGKFTCGANHGLSRYARNGA